MKLQQGMATQPASRAFLRSFGYCNAMRMFRVHAQSARVHAWAKWLGLGSLDTINPGVLSWGGT